jgi:carbamoyltransferase
MYVLGISAFYHDSAAAILKNGELVYAAQEERFTRQKHDASFPKESIRWGLKTLGISLKDIDCFVFYDKPLWKFDRLLQSYLAYAPKGFSSFVSAMPIWVKEKVFLRSLILEELESIDALNTNAELLFNEHHKSHAASAFYPSPYNEAAILCLDGVGEWATSSFWVGNGKNLKPIWEIKFPHSLGLLYSTFTYYTGFKVNSGEYKLMGLAPYGEPKYKNLILEKLLDLKADGSFRLRMEYFNYVTGLTMSSPAFHELFGGSPRNPESPITQKEMDLASSVQAVTEEILLRISRSAKKATGSSNLCLAGGVALNCVANGKLLREKIFDSIWVQPAAGDAGGAIGAAYSAWHDFYEKERPQKTKDALSGSFLGPSFTEEEISQSLKKNSAVCKKIAPEKKYEYLAERLANGAVLGWFQGRMEFGPRALGARSIIGDPRNPKMQSIMNLKIKFRESFRPFAPAVLEEKVSEYFQFSEKSPYMMFVANVCENRRIHTGPNESKLFGIEKLNIARSDIPAITHVDGSARIQTVSKETNPHFHELLLEFEKKTGCAVLINTSFNVRGEPIVAMPEDAYRCFMRTEMDILCIGDFILEKSEQPKWQENEDWRSILVSD